ncbi:MAG: DUF4347 domain-containing protein, partial [Burkholderiales bacterium]|nr:DUF4347 domain-containing protein [Burkholderiales bacterium]
APTGAGPSGVATRAWHVQGDPNAQAAVVTGSQLDGAPVLTSGHEIVFLDAAVPDAQAWLAALQAQADEGGRTLEVIRLDATRDGIGQISAVLAERQGVAAVHLISHGDDSGLQLGGTRLDARSLMGQAAEVSGWARALTADADWLLYGCDLASGEAGRALIADLALLTGADVAASDDLTGASALGGDWVLEHHVGAIETQVAVGAAFQADWQQVLATATIQEGLSGYNSTQDTHIANGSAANNGGSAELIVTTQNSQQMLLRFDKLFVSQGGTIPDNAKINSATLRLYITEDGVGQGLVSRVLSANWTEASTWDSLGGGLSLDNVEASATPDGSNDLSDNNSYINYNVLNTVQAWSNGASNLGWVMYTSNAEWSVASSENGTAAYRPQLIIDYTAPTPPALDLNGGLLGDGHSATFTEGTPVNVTNSLAATVTAGTNGVSPNLDRLTVTITNVQNAGLERLTWDVSGTNITGSMPPGSNVLTLSGDDTAANYQKVLRTLQYVNDSDNPNTTTRNITFVAHDPYGGNGNTVSTSVSVIAVDDAPVIGSNGGGANATVLVAETRTAVTTVVATDAEGSAVSYSIIGGADAGKFSINSSTGVLTFNAAPDFENPTDVGGNNVYDVIVRASAGGQIDTQTLAVNVTDVGTALVVDTTANDNDTGMGASFTAEQLNANKGADGKVSLREAIIAANTTAGLDVVSFALTGPTGAFGEYVINLTSTLPTVTEAIHLNAATQAGYATQPLVVLDGNGGAGHGLTLSNSADGSTIRGFVIRDFGADGIHIDSGSDNHTIVGNFIGSFNADGSFAGAGEQNASEGIESYGANVVIGGLAAGDGNAISGNGSPYNIYLASGANGTVLQGNRIGTDAAGTVAFANNSAYGVMVESSSSSVTIGGTAAGAGNVISGFTSHGIWFTTTGTATIQGNQIGTDVTGLVDLGNGGYGIYLDDGGSALIGGSAVGAGNLISGNNTGGVYAGNSGGVTLQGNVIGLNASGTAALANTGVGVYLNTAAASTIGGAGAARNVISGNTSHGLAIHSSPTGGHVVKGNLIGVGSDGSTLLGNGGSGVYIAASNQVIGGKVAGEGNVIAGNAGAGINVASGLGNLYYRNSIHSNAALGIDVDNNGVTPNDPNDGDGGANYRNNFPVITSVVTEGGVTRILGSIDFYSDAPIYIEFFSNPSADASGHGQGRVYLGSVLVNTNASNGDGSFSIDVGGVNVGDWISAVANVESGYIGASEFARAVQAVAPANGPRGKLIWNINDQFYQAYADWDGSGFSQVGTNGLAYGDDISMLAAAEAPTREEIIFIGSADVSGKILAGVWNGSSWSSVISLPVASPSATASLFNSFAIRYDEVNGNAMLVWDNGNTGTAGLSYATWDGSSWSAINTIAAPLSGEPVHMKLAAHPSSHEMILAVTTTAASNNQYALVWDGSSWGQAQTLGTNSSKQYFEINVAYESHSGQAMVIYDASAANGSAIQYRTWDGSSWGAEASLGVPAGVSSASELHTTVLTSDPTSDRLALAAKNAANEVWLHVWNGSAWDSGQLATASGVTLADHHATMDLAFEARSGQLLAVYGQAAGPSTFYRTWSEGSGWSAQQSGPSMGASDVPYVVKLYADPYSDTIMLGVQDSAADLNMAAWDGASWGSVNTLSAATGFTYRENFTFVWYRDAAVIAHVDGDSLTYQEGSGAVVIDQGGDASVTLDANGSYDGAVLAVSFFSGGAPGEDVLSVRHQGGGAGQIGVSGASVSHAGVLIGTLSGGSGGTPLRITLNANATDAAVSALLRNVTYANTQAATPDTTDRVVRFQIESAGGQLSGASDVHITVHSVNDAPVNTVPGPQSVAENGALTFSSANGNAISVNDVDAGSAVIEVQLTVLHGRLTVPSVSGSASSTVTLSGTLAQIQAHLAEVVYTPDASYSGADTLTVATSDLGNSGSGGTLTDTDQVAITVTAVNDAPVITSNGGGASSAINVAEGSTAVTTVTATDADAGATLTYSLSGGADQARFSINASTGELSFIGAPDREAPSDSGGDNVYDVEVTVSDGVQSDTQALSVTVTDLNDTAPVITSNGGGASSAINVA